MDENQSDEQLWQLVKRGEGSAYGTIFDRHIDRITRHASRLVASAQDAEDVVAITFFEAWRRRDSVRFVEGTLLPWLLVTAGYAARNVSRSARRHRALLQRLPVPDATVLVSEPEDTPTIAALRTLSTSDQQLITLCDLYGYAPAESAIVLGISNGAIRSRLSRARRRLAEATKAPRTELERQT